MIKLGIIMDSITKININKDSSFAILLEAQNRNYKIYYMEMNDLYLINGEARANARLINVEKNINKWYTFKSEQDLFLADLDVILMRKNPPFDNEYVLCTYILESAERKGTFIINKPQSLRDCNEKIFNNWFSNLMPETLVTRSKEKLNIFRQKYRNIIIKPLYEMGGNSIFYIKDGDPNFNVITEILTKYGNCYCIAQNYISDIINGDKRVLIIDGKPIPYCLVRIPQNNEIRANLAVGGYGIAHPLTENDWKIANIVGQKLKSKGLFFVGLDIIGNYLTEINITSPTCICEIETAYSISITSILVDAIEKNLNHNT